MVFDVTYILTTFSFAHSANLYGGGGDSIHVLVLVLVLQKHIDALFPAKRLTSASDCVSPCMCVCLRMCNLSESTVERLVAVKAANKTDERFISVSFGPVFFLFFFSCFIHIFCLFRLHKRIIKCSSNATQPQWMNGMNKNISLFNNIVLFFFGWLVSRCLFGREQKGEREREWRISFPPVNRPLALSVTLNPHDNFGHSIFAAYAKRI